MNTISLNYYGLKADGGRYFRIVLSISWRGERLIHYTGMKVKEHQWDRTKKIFVNLPDADALNEALSSMAKEVLDLQRSLSIRYGDVTRRHLKTELKKIRFNSQQSITRVFLRFMEVNEDSWSKNTFLRCKSFYPKLLKFTDFYGSQVSLESADHIFLESFDSFLKREGFNSNSRYSYLNLFKWFLKWCKDEKLLIQDDFKSFSLKEIKRENYMASPAYLKYEELMQLMKSNPQSIKHQHARDIYCFMSLTGIQLNELQSLRSDDIEDNFIYIRKGKRRKIPLNDHAALIARNYSNKYYRGGSYFPPYTKMTLTKYIRQLSVFLKFDRSLSVQRRGRLIEAPLYELITINSAKWTFYANMIHYGLPVAIIQKWNGNKNTDFYLRIREDLQKLENESVAVINRDYENTL